MTAPEVDIQATLCRPDHEKSCFACCPPIRPPGYDHLPWRSSLTRLLVDNTARFRKSGPRPEPIVGYFCWGLGFLDASGKRIGCLLHPAQNQGQDLRDLTGYGDKCRRETCPPARTFARLTEEQQQCLLGLVQGLDSFQYSSPNLLWSVLSWGGKIAAGLADLEGKSVLGGARLRAAYPLLARPDLDGRSWPLERLVDCRGPAVLTRPDLADYLESLVTKIRARVMTVIDPPLARQGAAPDRERPPALIRFISRGLGRPALAQDRLSVIREIINTAASAG